MIQRYGVLGSGQVGQTLAKGLKKHGYQVMIGSRTPAKLAEFGKASGIATGSFRDVSKWAEGLVLAVGGTVAQQALEEAGKANLKGKLVIDVTNPIAKEPPEDGVVRFFTGPNDSLMERLQKAFPDARFVKAFSCVGNAFMVNPSFPAGKPTMFYCGEAGRRAAARAVRLRPGGHGEGDRGAGHRAPLPALVHSRDAGRQVEPRLPAAQDLRR